MPSSILPFNPSRLTAFPAQNTRTHHGELFEFGKRLCLAGFYIHGFLEAL